SGGRSDPGDVTAHRVSHVRLGVTDQPRVPCDSSRRTLSTYHMLFRPWCRTGLESSTGTMVSSSAEYCTFLSSSSIRSMTVEDAVPSAKDPVVLSMTPFTCWNQIPDPKNALPSPVAMVTSSPGRGTDSFSPDSSVVSSVNGCGTCVSTSRSCAQSMLASIHHDPFRTPLLAGCPSRMPFWIRTLFTGHLRPLTVTRTLSSD